MTPLSSALQQPRSPVLEGLTHIGLSGKEIATLSDVTAPTISKWRGGKCRPPAAAIVFLTLVLAHKVEELEDIEWQLDERGGGWASDLADQLDGARACLRFQETCNAAMSPEAIHEGARRYRDWLNAGGFGGMRSNHAGMAGPLGATA
ncbi:MAG: hypothetical protein RIC16_10855 [Rhodospirillales bacterium]